MMGKIDNTFSFLLKKEIPDKECETGLLFL